MPTFVYAPGVKVYIDTQKHGVVDVSDDLTQGSMVRRSDGVSTFEFGLQNRQRKYDQFFAPNDRIVVMMKRVTWVRVFTGYLNTVPLITAWPSDVTLAASCSLKRLQYWYWDSYAPYTQQMIRNALGYGDQGQGDGGATSVLLSVLDQVVGWPASKVHVGKIPAVWLDFAYEIAESVQREASSEAPDLNSILGNGSGTTSSSLTITQTGPIMVPNVVDQRQTDANNASYQSDPLKVNNYSAPGSNSSSSSASSSAINSGTVKPGQYGGYNFTAERMQAVRAVWRVGKDQKRSDETIAFAIYCAMAETNLKASYAVPSGASQGFGMFSQLTPASLAKNTDRQVTQFFSRYDRLRLNAGPNPNWLELSKAVQRWGSANQYAQGGKVNIPNRVYQTAAREVVRLLGQASGAQASTGAGATPTSNSSLIPGAKILETADQLVGQDIPYKHSQGIGFSKLARKTKDELKSTGLDCSGLAYWVFEQALGYGRTPFIPKVQNGVNGVFDYCQKHGKIYKAPQDVNSPLYKLPGAFLFVLNRNGAADQDHVGIALGDGTKKAVQATYMNGPPALITTDNWNYVGLVTKYVDYSGGPGTGVSVNVPNAPSSAVPSGTEVPRDVSSTIPYSGPATPTINVGSSGPSNSLFGSRWEPGPIDAASMTEAASLTGIRALMNDQPLLPYLKNLMNSTMRSYCSAPNGDFMAWFPDYYGIWGTAAKMIIEPIEVQDFQVYWTDDFFVTHQYVVAGQFNFLDVSTGGVNTQTYLTSGGGADLRTQTLGIATIEIPAIMKGLFNIDVGNGEEFKNYIFNRFGARPDFQMVDGIVGKRSEFFAALYMFMRQWVYQYNADIPLTFMPELYPGMLIQIPYLDFQAYVVTVTHTFQFGQGGGFNTSVNIAAPAKIGGSSKDQVNVFVGLPDFGGLSKPGPNNGFDLSETTSSDPSFEATNPDSNTADPAAGVGR